MIRHLCILWGQDRENVSQQARGGNWYLYKRHIKKREFSRDFLETTIIATSSLSPNSPLRLSSSTNGNVSDCISISAWNNGYLLNWILYPCGIQFFPPRSGIVKVPLICGLCLCGANCCSACLQNRHFCSWLEPQTFLIPLVAFSY